jgi:hypothetical protein
MDEEDIALANNSKNLERMSVRETMLWQERKDGFTEELAKGTPDM